jgi:hypothetical protein
MIRKLTTREPQTQNHGVKKRMLNWTINCNPTTCIPYCGGLRDVAFDTAAAIQF